MYIILSCYIFASFGLEDKIERSKRESNYAIPSIKGIMLFMINIHVRYIANFYKYICSSIQVTIPIDTLKQLQYIHTVCI